MLALPRSDAMKVFHGVLVYFMRFWRFAIPRDVILAFTGVGSAHAFLRPILSAYTLLVPFDGRIVDAIGENHSSQSLTSNMCQDGVLEVQGEGRVPGSPGYRAV